MAERMMARSAYSQVAKRLIRSRVWMLPATMLLAVLLASGVALSAAGDTTRVSVSSSGTQGNSYSNSISMSSDGRFVTFESNATNLVPDDTNGVVDIFVHDRQTNTTERVSVDNSGTQGNDASVVASISADGRFVAFSSDATNLVPDDTNGASDVFVRDRQAGTTERVSVNSSEVQGNDFSGGPSISADGRFVAFGSWATNLVANDTSIYTPDAFVRDRQTGTTERVSVNSSEVQGNGSSGVESISTDGRFVAFSSWAKNLVSGDTNGVEDIFVRDRQAGTTERVSVNSSEVQGNEASNSASISADGRFVAFRSNASNLVPDDTSSYFRDIFVRDRLLGTTRRVSVDSSGKEANVGSYGPSISADGRFVAFYSRATNLVPGDTNDTEDIYVRDRQTRTTQLASVNSSGNQGNSRSDQPSISADGRFVAFSSYATNLVPDDTNSTWDNFVHEFQVDTIEPTVVSVVPAGGTTGVSRGVNVKATFSERVYYVKPNFKLYRKGSSTPVDAVVYSVAGTNNRKWVLNPDGSLRADTTYIAKVQTGVMDQVGHNLAQPKQWTFKTRS